MNQRVKAYRARHREAGLCIECDTPAEGYARCKVHRKTASGRQGGTVSLLLVGERQRDMERQHEDRLAEAQRLQLLAERKAADLEYELKGYRTALAIAEGRDNVVDGKYALPAPSETTPGR